MFHTISQKFYAIVIVLVSLYVCAFVALNYFINEQSSSARRGQEDVLIEREVRSLQDLFFEIRFWGATVISHEHPGADRKFGALLKNIKSRLAAIKGKELDPTVLTQLEKVSDFLAYYENDFNRIVQLKTQQQLNRTIFVSNSRSLTSTVLKTRKQELLWPIFNLLHYQSKYLANHHGSEFQALKVVMSALETKFRKTGLLKKDDRMTHYIRAYKELLEENYAFELELRQINEKFLEISTRLMNLFAQISQRSETLLRNEFRKAEKLRKRMMQLSLGFSILSIITLVSAIILMARNIVNPIRNLAAVMRGVKSGDHEIRFQMSGNQKDEIVHLGQTFNGMLDTLGENNRQLVQAQKELEDKVEQLAAREEELEKHRNHLEELVEERTSKLKDAVEQLQKEIHRRKDIEAELKQHRERLEIMVEARTEDLKKAYHELQIEMKERKVAEEQRAKLEVQLQRSEKMEAIGTLAGGVAHDLNNILSGVVSYPELLLLELSGNDPMRKPIEIIKQSGEKAANIVQDLLTLARRGVAVTEVVSLNQIISEYMVSPEYANLLFYHLNVQVETRLERNLLNIMGSPVHLEKTVMNLVSNAAEAMPNGGDIRIFTQNRYIDKAIRGYDDVREGDYVTLVVSDTGVGIPGHDLERIFEPFYTKKVMGRSGTGLGMAVVWGTVKDHHGYINVESTEGEGTTFTLYFPISRKNLVKPKSVLALEEYLGKGESILVVDDIEEQRAIAGGMLRKLGYNVEAVSSGEKAVGFVEKNQVDLVILDMIMDPGMDGLETYKAILEKRPHQKAIIASGFSETERVKDAQKLGAGGYVKKPYTLEKIGIAVRNELTRE
ncbi:MAG: response regulator [Desulfobacterales bacterium]|nr:response regulator [Desulfobacterales bacterium]